MKSLDSLLQSWPARKIIKSGLEKYNISLNPQDFGTIPSQIQKNLKPVRIVLKDENLEDDAKLEYQKKRINKIFA